MGLLTITPVARTLNSVTTPYTTVRNINANRVYDVRAANSAEIAVASTAATAIIIQGLEYNQPYLLTYITAASTSAVLASIAAAQSGILGAAASGDATLVAGTVNVAIPGLTTSSKVVLTRHTAGGTVTSTVEYFYVVSAGQLTITAAVAAGTINTADTSVITYAIVG